MPAFTQVEIEKMRQRIYNYWLDLQTEGNEVACERFMQEGLTEREEKVLDYISNYHRDLIADSASYGEIADQIHRDFIDVEDEYKVRGNTLHEKIKMICAIKELIPLFEVARESRDGDEEAKNCDNIIAVLTPATAKMIFYGFMSDQKLSNTVAVGVLDRVIQRLNCSEPRNEEEFIEAIEAIRAQENTSPE